jgi:DNA mismatch repair protein MutS
MINCSMAVVHRDGELVFLRRLIEGAAGESYGLEVARLAGISGGVLARAGEILQRINENEKILGDLPALSPEGNSAKKSVPPWTAKLLNELRSLDPDRLSPLDALNLIHAWKNLVCGEKKEKGKSAAPAEGPGLFD